MALLQKVLGLSFAVALLAWAAPSAPAADGPAVVTVPAAARTILSDAGQWHWRIARRRPIVPVDALRAYGKPAEQPAVIPVHDVPFSNWPDIELLETAPPPAEWTGAEFDDSAWPVSPVAGFGSPYYQTGVICARGRFEVADPAAVKGLYLTARYRGGAVVYLNGVEVARNDMPAGPLTLSAAASPYPDGAWVDSQGKRLLRPSIIDARIKAGEKDLADRVASRQRSLGPIRIPADALREGTNVLAVAVHRADYHPVALEWFNQQNIHDSWIPIALQQLTLQAEGTGIEPNLARPEGVQLWNSDIHERLTGDEYGDPTEPLRPIRIVAARNGCFSGMVVLSSTQPLRGVVAGMTDLAAEGGTIPASAVDVRYVVRTDGATSFHSTRPYYCFDALEATSPGDLKLLPAAAGQVASSLQPIWIRVNVPKDAAAGLYKGTLRVIAVGFKLHLLVPVEVEVIGWTLPDAAAFRTHAGVYQSPTSLAMQYNVPMWSDEHWALMEASFALLARLGNDLVNVPVVDQTQFGNDQGWVRWIRKPGGGWDYDFTILDRYLALVKKHLGVPRFVSLQVWHAGGWAARKVDDPNTVTVLDPATGRTEPMQVPVFGTPESKRFWTDALAAIRGRLAKVGMAKSACLGILSDSTAPDEVLRMFAEIAPDLGWMRGCHGQSNAPKPYKINGGATVVYHEHCYGMSIPNPEARIAKIWETDGPIAAYFRSDFDGLVPMGYRAIAERALYEDKCGYGRMGLDFWMFSSATVKGEDNDVYNRWPQSSCAQRRPTLMKLAWHSPQGPVPTIRFELLLEGTQEAEAAIFVAEAAARHADRLGAKLAAECHDLIVERINVARILNGFGGVAARDYTGWQARSERLYKLAARVAEKLVR